MNSGLIGCASNVDYFRSAQPQLQCQMFNWKIVPGRATSSKKLQFAALFYDAQLVKAVRVCNFAKHWPFLRPNRNCLLLHEKHKWVVSYPQICVKASYYLSFCRSCHMLFMMRTKQNRATRNGHETKMDNQAADLMEIINIE